MASKRSGAGNANTTDEPDEDSPNKIKEEELFKEEDAKLAIKKEVTDLIVKEEIDQGDVTIQDLNNYLSFGYGCCSYFAYFFMGLSSALL